MIDLHCHILPGLDDGPSNLDFSLAMARAAVEAGTQLIVATPHIRADFDVDPVENPYLEGGRVHPRAGRAFLDRSRVRPGMATPKRVLVRAFAAAGWQWGGRWTGSPDYQHFSATGG